MVTGLPARLFLKLYIFMKICAHKCYLRISVRACALIVKMVYSRASMATNVQVSKNQNESSANVIRRFTKRMQGSGIIPRMRKIRYYARTKSENVRREARLKKLVKKDVYEKDLKLGKIQERVRRRR